MCMKTKETWTNRPTESGHLRRNDMLLTAKTSVVTHKMTQNAVKNIIPARINVLCWKPLMNSARRLTDGIMLPMVSKLRTVARLQD